MAMQRGDKAWRISAAFLAKKGAALATQDREWTKALPDGWFVLADAAAAWGLAKSTSSHRLALLRVSGAVLHRGSGPRGGWKVRGGGA